MFGSNENRLLRKALALYGGERVLKKVLDGGEAALVPEARSLELTMLNIDVASVSPIDGGLDPVALGNFSVDYCDAITRAVYRCNGTFDTFVGDAASAWWGEDGEIDHAIKACTCGRELLSAIEELNATSLAKGYPQIRIKVGIHSGLVSLGNFGSSSRLRYTVMGDAVNLASRLCAVAGTGSLSPILISGATKERLDDGIPFVVHDAVRVKGKDDLVEIFGIAL
jgi:adenylate cyclase